MQKKWIKCSLQYEKRMEFFKKLMSDDISILRYEIFFSMKKSIFYNIVADYNTSFWTWGKEDIENMEKLLSEVKKNYEDIFSDKEIGSVKKAKLAYWISKIKASAFSRMIGDESEESWKESFVSGIESEWKNSIEKKEYEKLKEKFNVLGR